MRGDETVRVLPQVQEDRLRGPSGTAPAPYDLEDCSVLPRATSEVDKGVVGIQGFDVYYYGPREAPASTWRVEVRGEVHEIDDVPRDFRKRGRRKALIFATKKVGRG